MHSGADDDLMQAARLGNKGAFALIVERHRSWVFAIMMAHVHNRETAEDLTQDAFCRVMSHLNRYTAAGSFVPWLKRIAANVARDHLRRERNAHAQCSEAQQESLAGSPQSEPEAVLQSRFLRQELRDAIQCLPDDQRLALAMHYFGDMSVDEVAWAMKCPVGTVRSRLFYGLKRIRVLMSAETHLTGDADEG